VAQNNVAQKKHLLERTAFMDATKLAPDTRAPVAETLELIV